MLWNADGVRGKCSELLDFVNERGFDVIAICESRLTPQIHFNLPNYKCYRQDKHISGRGQGVAILVKANIEHSHISVPPTEHLEAVAIQLNLAALKYTLVSIYQSPNLSLKGSDLDVLFKMDSKVLLMGDFNARHKFWYGNINNGRGNALFNYLLNNDYNLHAPLAPTLIHYQTDFTHTLPDLVISKNLADITQPIAITALSSNHLPVCFDILLSFDRVSKLQYVYSKADWDLYRLHINRNLQLSSHILPNTFEVEKAISYFTDLLHQA